MSALTAGARDVLAERARQQQELGWTHSHDDNCEDMELAAAASAYASYAARNFRDPKDLYSQWQPPLAWPWSRSWWKPKDPRRDLVRAGALILAQIERIDREHGEPPAPGHAALLVEPSIATRDLLAAIHFALHARAGLEFLRCWSQGEWDDIAASWPEFSSGSGQPAMAAEAD